MKDFWEEKQGKQEKKNKQEKNNNFSYISNTFNNMYYNRNYIRKK